MSVMREFAGCTCLVTSFFPGFLTGHKVIGVQMVIEDGASHAVDSSEMAFMLAGRAATWAHLSQGNPTVLEPVMSVEVVTPEEFQVGGAQGQLDWERIGSMDGSGSLIAMEEEERGVWREEKG